MTGPRFACLRLPALLLLLGSAPAHAQSVRDGGSRTLAPLSYVAFCQRNTAECQPGRQAYRPLMQDWLLAMLEEVNDRVNRSILSRPPPPAGGIETWRINPAAGDCNDFAVSKRHQLVALGLPRSALLLASALTRKGEPHLVLIVRTRQGDLVLDNLQGGIVLRQNLDYRWLKQETPGDALLWEDMS